MILWPFSMISSWSLCLLPKCGRLLAFLTHVFLCLFYKGILSFILLQFYSQPCFGHKVYKEYPLFSRVLSIYSMVKTSSSKPYQVSQRPFAFLNSLVQADIDVLTNSSLECLGFQRSLQARLVTFEKVLFWKWVWFDGSNSDWMISVKSAVSFSVIPSSGLLHETSQDVSHHPFAIFNTTNSNILLMAGWIISC